MALPSGTKLGPYEIVSPLGAGGMGEVYRARDSRLHRDVAIKVSAERFSDRFDREAHAIAQLNHPFICTLYDVGPNYLVMELVEGETLAERLKKGPLPIDKALRCAVEIASALAAAHEKGVVHRDLKPANVMLSKSGVKVLDFGLAQMAGPDADTVTLTRGVVGTPAYMAPEQLQGNHCDARTDIFAFGLVLYEMVTGKRASAALNVHASPQELPAAIAWIVQKSIASEPENRWQSASDLKAVLERSTQVQPLPQKQSARAGPILAALALIALLILGAFALFRRPALPELPMRLNLNFAGLTEEGDATPVPAPSGQNFVFVAFDATGRRSLWVRPLNSQSARQLPGSEDAEQPFWSADGRWIGFYAQGNLKKISPSGDGLQTIAQVRGLGRGATWNQHGDIVFAPDSRLPLYLVRESGGPARVLTSLDASRAENSHRYPVFLPDGRHFLFVARSGQRENNALYLGSVDSQNARRLMMVQSNVSYAPPRDGRVGALLFIRDGALVAQPFDGEHVIGQPSVVVESVDYNAPSIYGAFSVSANGSILIFRPAVSGRTRLTWFDRKGTDIGTVGPPGDYMKPRISPDGSRILYTRPDEQSGNRDVWYLETSRGVAQRLTTNPANDWWPVWAPDGRGILFSSDRLGGTNLVLYSKTSLDPGVGESRLGDLPNALVEDWSSSGRWIAFIKSTPAADVMILPASGPARTPFLFFGTPFYEASPRFSPDEKWIAYVSNESGRYEVYVRPFAGGPAPETGKIQVSSSGADFPVWAHDGKELFFIGADLKLYSVQTSGFGHPKPEALFAPCRDTVLAGLPLRGTPWVHPYDVAPDGQRFLINCSMSSPGRFDVMLNWMPALK